MMIPLGSVHYFMAGKGGIGKTVSTVLFTQILLQAGRRVKCFDVDPVNASLASFKALDALQVDLTRSGQIDSQKLDELVDKILASPNDCVIDNGTSSFLPFLSYLIENDVFGILRDSGKTVIVHVVVTGGPPMQDTLTGFESLVSQIPSYCKVVVWINEFFGEPMLNGEPIRFEDIPLFSAFHEQIIAFIRIKERSKETFGRDIGRMLEKNLTFDEAISSPDFSMMARQRLTMIRRHLQDQLEELIHE